MPQNVLVVCAHSVCLFPFPILKVTEDLPLCNLPIARHSFGWVDGVFVQFTGENHLSRSIYSADKPLPLSILVRAETDDPWASDDSSLELYTLHVNPHYLEHLIDDKTSCVVHETPITSSMDSLQPYCFPPVLTSTVDSRRGSLRCTDILLGRLGTALWLQPKDRSVAGLYWTADDALAGPQNVERSKYRYESLVAGIFPGTLFPGVCQTLDKDVLKVEPQIIRWNEGQSWSSIAYDEDVGRIVLARGFGDITILDM